MESINRSEVRERVSNIYDTMHAAQATANSTARYVKQLYKAVGLHKELMGDTKEFLRDIGGRGL